MLATKHSVHTETIIIVHMLFLIFRSASEVYKSLLGSIKHSFISPPFSFSHSFAKQTLIHVVINTFVTLLTFPCWQSVVLHLKHRQPTAYTVYNHIYRDYFSFSPPFLSLSSSLCVSLNSSPPSSIHLISVFSISNVYGLSKHV